MIALFTIVFTLILLTELIKGLSANGTPPVLQRFSWQLDLAYFMWSNIVRFRIILVIALLVIVFFMSPQERSAIIGWGILFCVGWAFIYWFFNHFWVGKHKFKLLDKLTFVKADENEVELSAQVLGIEYNGVTKAYPAVMAYHHHTIADSITDMPISMTYCGLCRSGRIYDVTVDGQALDLRLVGAVNYNAVLRDTHTGTWWRQETGEAAKGHHKGKVLKDMPMEQMSLEHWLEKHPDSLILQYDPQYQHIYNFLTKLLKYETTKPGWTMQKEPPTIIGLEINGEARAYDWNELKRRKLVMDTFANTDLLLISSEDEASPFTYNRTLNGEILEFSINGNELTDSKTGSKWNIFGQCIAGELQGSELKSVHHYQQFVRSWIKFHPDTSFYDYFDAPMG